MTVLRMDEASASTIPSASTIAPDIDGAMALLSVSPTQQGRTVWQYSETAGSQWEGWHDMPAHVSAVVETAYRTYSSHDQIFEITMPDGNILQFDFRAMRQWSVTHQVSRSIRCVTITAE